MTRARRQPRPDPVALAEAAVQAWADAGPHLYAFTEAPANFVDTIDNVAQAMMRDNPTGAAEEDLARDAFMRAAWLVGFLVGQRMAGGAR